MTKNATDFLKTLMVLSTMTTILLLASFMTLDTLRYSLEKVETEQQTYQYLISKNNK